MTIIYLILLNVLFWYVNSHNTNSARGGNEIYFLSLDFFNFISREIKIKTLYGVFSVDLFSPKEMLQRETSVDN